MPTTPTPPPDRSAPTLGLGGGDLAATIVAHQHRIWRYLRLLGADPDEADDLLQETFVVFATSPRPDPLRSPPAWLCGIARHLLLAHRKKQRRAPPEADWLDAVDRLTATEPWSFADERLPALRDCLKRLTTRARQALEWHHQDGLPRREVAARLGLGEEGAKSLLERSRDLLRDCVQRRLITESSQ